MSQENADFKIEIPGPLRWKIARTIAGNLLARKVAITHNDLSAIPPEGAGISISNHRSDTRDVKSLGWVLRKWRTPLIPAKDELQIPDPNAHRVKQIITRLNAWFMEGSGAMFFNRDDPESRKAVYEQMGEELAAGHHLHIFIEETSKNRGRELGALTPSPVLLAMNAELDDISLIGIGGTEDRQSKHVHMEFGSLSLSGLKSIVELKQELAQGGKRLTLREAAVILAHTEDVNLASNEVLHEIANPDPSKRRGQRRERKSLRDPNTHGIDRLMLYSLFTEQVVRQKLQSLVDVAQDIAA